MTWDTRNADIYPPLADRTFYESVKKSNQKKAPCHAASSQVVAKRHLSPPGGMRRRFITRF